jgi:uncharacterized small protein (DUF1192 family)
MEHLEAVRQHMLKEYEKQQKLEELFNLRISDLEERINRLQEVVTRVKQENRDKEDTIEYLEKELEKKQKKAFRLW